MPDRLLFEVKRHLFGSHSNCEEAGFLLANMSQNTKGVILECLSWLPIPPDGYVHRSAYYLEMRSETQAKIIKSAHDARAALIEVHSHPTQERACFSWSDLRGFDEFVSHVLWRLPRRPYAAIVMTQESFDGLYWDDPSIPLQVGSISTESGHIMQATSLTKSNWDELYEKPTI